MQALGLQPALRRTTSGVARLKNPRDRSLGLVSHRETPLDVRRQVCERLRFVLADVREGSANRVADAVADVVQVLVVAFGLPVDPRRSKRDQQALSLMRQLFGL